MQSSEPLLEATSRIVFSAKNASDRYFLPRHFAALLFVICTAVLVAVNLTAA
jgi:hypothetical protein